MIEDEDEYEQARSRLNDAKRRLPEHEESMKEAQFDASQRKRALDPLRSFMLQLEEEIEAYERARNGSST